ncbi:MAG: PAS domain-containing protein [Candidatus Omnitrophica bacterium]|nr:PAS domain-containing protein [Candidatus Omnitrophota bacterium]
MKNEIEKLKEIIKNFEEKELRWKKLAEAVSEANAYAAILVAELENKNEALANSQKLSNERKEFIENVINSLESPFYVINTRFEIILANKAAIERGVILGKHCYECTHKVNEPCHGKDPCPLQEVMKLKKSVKMDHVHYLNNKEVIVEVHGDPIFDEDGNVVKMIEYAIDITERKNYENRLKNAYEKLKEVQEQLIQAGKMVVVGELASGIAHEVKNPLAIILQGIDYLDKKISSNDANITSALKYMNDAVHRADGIIRGLLDFSTSSNLTLVCMRVEPIIESALFLVKNLLDKNKIKVEKEIEKNLAQAKLDKSKLEQVLVNIFLNAISEMPDGGTLTVRAFADKVTQISEEAGRRVTDRFELGQPVIVIEVEDTGHGLSEEVKEKIFVPFFTTKRAKGGTGLGLGIAKNIIEQHSGKITIDNKPQGQGARVRITIKACAANG